MVVGISGSGKSTLARRLATRLDAPHIELDALFHQPNWGQLPGEQLRAQVTELAAGPAWVIDGNYAAVQDLVLARADTVIWLDLPRRLVMRQLVPRTLARMITRRPLWNGNTEDPRNLLSRDPARNILLWAWTQHARMRHRYQALAANPAHARLRFIRLRSRAQVRDF
jgi:adenylate kinase family enzyme